MQFRWRVMDSADLEQVLDIAGIVHPGFHEDDAILANKLALFGEGCFVLEVDADVVGYVFSHPWIFGDVPKLNTQIAALPLAPDTYFIHDLALLPALRGFGMAGAMVSRSVDMAREAGMASLSLCAVSGSAEFWQRQGFVVSEASNPSALLASYGKDVHFMQRALPLTT